MAILICGGAGYVGSHVNKELYKEGYDTVVFDNLIYGHREAVKWGIFVQGDLANLDELERIFSMYDVEAVFHFAAFAYVGESVKEPEKYYYNNVVNTLNLLQVMKKYGCNKIVFSSTCATYGEPEQVPIVESMPQHPINPYGATKLMVERILKDYHQAYGMEYVILRYFNVAGSDPEGDIGESHNPETHIIPLMLDVAGGQRSDIKVFGGDYNTLDGSCIRDYIHVSDLANAHLLALHHLEKGKKSDCFNLGNTKCTSVLEVLEAARRVTGRDIKAVIAPRRLGDASRLMGNSDKAKYILGWKPKYDDIDIIIKHAWEWHENRKY